MVVTDGYREQTDRGHDSPNSADLSLGVDTDSLRVAGVKSHYCWDGMVYARVMPLDALLLDRSQRGEGSSHT